jgi:hypothetical protein
MRAGRGGVGRLGLELWRDGAMMRHERDGGSRLRRPNEIDCSAGRLHAGDAATSRVSKQSPRRTTLGGSHAYTESYHEPTLSWARSVEFASMSLFVCHRRRRRRVVVVVAVGGGGRRRRGRQTSTSSGGQLSQRFVVTGGQATTKAAATAKATPMPPSGRLSRAHESRRTLRARFQFDSGYSCGEYNNNADDSSQQEQSSRPASGRHK